MKKNGFTLIEMLAVIAILIILALMVTKQVGEGINKTKEVAYNTQISEIENAVKLYINQNPNLIENENGYYIMTITDLKQANITSNKNYINPKTNQELTGCVVSNEVSSVYSEECEVNKVFEYTGGEQTYNVPITGYYKLETWGAQGGLGKSGYSGLGGYSTGIIKLNKNETLYINVGGQGESYNGRTGLELHGGYNGGGNATNSSSYSDEGYAAGGGATHIATASGILSSLENKKDSIVIVAGAGGGGGQNSSNYNFANGGGYSGVNGGEGAIAGNQMSGGAAKEDSDDHLSSYSGSFGQGGNGRMTYRSYGFLGSGGGAGYFGGGSSMWAQSGAGGSGYIDNTNLINKSMFCYNCRGTHTANIKTISTTGTSSERDTTNCPNGYSNNPISKCAKAGNGYAKITYVGIQQEPEQEQKTKTEIYYAYGNSYRDLYTSNTYQTTETEFLEDSIYLKNNGYYIVYTDSVDLSKYNTVIVKRTGFTNKNRGGFIQYPSQTNEEGEYIIPNWQEIDTNIYVGDISEYTRNDLKIFFNAWTGENTGNIYYIALSEYNIDEIETNPIILDELY